MLIISHSSVREKSNELEVISVVTFIIGLVILFVGAAIYGKLCDKVFGPDDRKTPAYTKQDGVDYVPMKSWKNSLINLLNIAGTGPILGPIQGILFGPIAFITIPIGNVIGGAFHDYFSGMISLRDGGTQMPGIIKKYTNKTVYWIYNIFVSLLLLLVGAVFIYTPGDIAATQVFGFSGDAHAVSTWVIYGVIFLYYLAATVFPIDAIIGKIYPVFGGILLFSAIGVFIGIFAKGLPLVEVWDSVWCYQGIFDYSEYFAGHHFLPVFFVTVACGILSGFHSTQTCIISRTMKSEKEGRVTFYWMMILEGFIAMVWAAGAMGVFNAGIQEATAGATSTVGVVCKYMLGNVGGIIAIIGVIVLPITSGDTALRGLRLTVAETLGIDQSTNGKRLGLSAIIYVLVASILVWAKFNPNGFNTLWRYFAWSNQTLSLFAFACITVWMCINGKSKWIWMPLIPGTFYAFITSTFIMNAKIGFNLPWAAAYVIGVLFAIAYLVVLIWYGNKRAAEPKKVL